jgi:hypothetical protein
MSHFTVIVVGENVAEQLQPFHEFECTGIDDQYVVNVDRTEEFRAAYETATTTRLRAPDGMLHGPWDNCFYRDPTPEEKITIGIGGSGCGGGISWSSRDWGDGQGYRAKVRFVPEGHVECEVMQREIRTFAEYAEYGTDHKPITGEPNTSGPHKYGWTRVDDRGEIIEIVRRTNPNAEWDWWVVGGRWTGFFTVRPAMPFSDSEWANFMRHSKGNKADSCRWGDVDVAAMEAAAREAASLDFAKWEPCFTTHGRPETWESVSGRIGDIEEARRVYHGQPALKAYREIEKWDDPMGMGFDRDAYVARKTRACVVPFAILKDGVWHEKGDMGWWACVSNERPDWTEFARGILDGLDPNVTVTLVDCHI